MAYEELMYRIHDDGFREYLDKDGKRHNPKGWALWSPGGTKEWFKHGRLHREDGPALEIFNGDTRYYLDGKPLTKEEWKQALGHVKVVK